MEKRNQEIENALKKLSRQEKIPEKLKPEQMKRFLEENAGNKRKHPFSKWYGLAAAAACLVLLVSVGRTMPGVQKQENEAKESINREHAGREETDVKSEDTGQEKADSRSEDTGQEKADSGNTDTAKKEEGYQTSYEELYAFFRKQEKEQEDLKYSEEEKEMAKGPEQEMAEDSSSQQGSAARKEYADTNKQEAGVDEGDIIKNDGRYLYQIVTNSDYSQTVQIADTKEGLKETARIEGFENVSGLYVQKDVLIAVESDWAEEADYMTADYEKEKQISCDTAMTGKPYQKIHVYNIKDRSNPQKQHVFTIEGEYLDSRIADGYLYFFVKRGVNQLNYLERYEDYIPVLEGKVMEASDIYLPKEAEASNYLVMISVDLKQPDRFKDTQAVVTAANHVYMADSAIYVTDSVMSDDSIEEGEYSNKTNLIRFSYKDGKMQKEAEGSVKGILLDPMAIQESNGYLRMAVTVETCRKNLVTDEVTGELIGYDTQSIKKDNSLYVLDRQLQIAGKIEGLAEGEQIYSARFMGDTGYFVTFRQTDPLFSVDLSDPENPRIAGELKISGFSEYLHFYKENLLLGIGMEADEGTGRTEGMKLSMFDISNPAKVTEQNKYSLEEYNYSEALYNYKAVMIDTEKNLFGFYAEGYNEGEEKGDYLLFSYEEGGFRQKMKIACDRDKNGAWVQVRGTYIGDTFYLMYGDGRMEGYSLKDGVMTESLTGKE